MYLVNGTSSLQISSEMELLDDMVVLLLIFFPGIAILFSTVATTIYIPTNSAQGFPFIHILTNTCYFLTF